MVDSVKHIPVFGYLDLIYSFPTRIKSPPSFRIRILIILYIPTLYNIKCHVKMLILFIINELMAYTAEFRKIRRNYVKLHW